MKNENFKSHFMKEKLNSTYERAGTTSTNYLPRDSSRLRNRMAGCIGRTEGVKVTCDTKSSTLNWSLVLSMIGCKKLMFCYDWTLLHKKRKTSCSTICLKKQKSCLLALFQELSIYVFYILFSVVFPSIITKRFSQIHACGTAFS